MTKNTSTPTVAGAVALDDLRQHLLALATLEESEAAVVSCYWNQVPGCRTALEERLRAARAQAAGGARERQTPDQLQAGLDDAMDRIRDFAREEASPEFRSAAAFARGGEAQFFLGLRFAVPLPALADVAVDAVPHIYPLVELRDSYDRYVAVLATSRTVRIIEVSLGAVVEKVSRTCPEPRLREGREWTKEHYRSHQRERLRLFVKEAVEALAELMPAKGYRHLVLAGEARAAAAVRKSLPKHLAAALVCDSALPGRESLAELVAEASSRFREREEMESRAMVEALEQAVMTNGRAVAGRDACFDALRRGQARILLMAREYAPGAGLSCAACDLMWAGNGGSRLCPACGGQLRPLDLKEALLRLAERGGCPVETIAGSEVLMRMGGVGCQLRFLGARQRALRRVA